MAKPRWKMMFSQPGIKITALSMMSFLGVFSVGSVALAASPPTPSSSNFSLTKFSATPNGSSTTYTLTMTVAQTSADGSDFGTGANSTQTEVHAFPPTIYLVLRTANGNIVDNTATNPLAATLISSTPAPGITYDKNETGSVYATAQYRVTMPQNTASSDTLEIYPYNAAPGSAFSNTQYVFRMGASNDPSFADDIVSGVTTVGTLPVGQLPEVPYAAGLPALGLAVVLMSWWSRQRYAKVSKIS
ncbi:hypothetical protein [Sulfobacillus thermosulfidooxidans]|uniref:hypothetical protein n=1 Tax=Sulfobacillus thermosulfidooxidans TaxID=28034 RepID=UPI00096BC218|nr:hypothetical protein [Sulfobacillus thermosulfidooxidans]OLZ11565.1 hypothetical protein BFX05_06075 [Sulfobacillus thermosulfidooxidans]OLZ17407.1 hypothetical protein BFX06_13505 [Sulfobacillus thermosulfidooxidans]OLZ21083.1 hypothetical protein BFX07_13790 [Sulfobacillus thermosulfidooxidans]